jgi:hypothetical protein
VDTQPFHVNTIDIACKKILVRPEMPDKGKSKDIIIGNPHMSNISKKRLLERLRTIRLKCPEAPRGRHN